MLKYFILFFILVTNSSYALSQVPKGTIEITAYPIAEMDSIIKNKIFNITDSIRAFFHNDSTAYWYHGSEDIFSRRIIVIVNESYSSDRPQFGSFINLYVCPTEILSNDYFQRLVLWKLNKVKKYGFCNINNCNILAVDMKDKHSFFTTTKEGGKTICIQRMKLSDPEDLPLWGEGFWEYSYAYQNDNLVPIMEFTPADEYYEY